MNDFKKNTLRRFFLWYSYFWGIMHFLSFLFPPPIRILLYKAVLKNIGKNVFIDYGVYFRFPWKIEIGNEVTINRNCSFYPSFFDKKHQIAIGNNVRIGPGVQFFGAGHNHSKISLPDNGGPIIIRDNVWVGGQCIILAGVTIEHGVVVSAGSTVTKDVEPMKIVAGSPAKVIGDRVLQQPVGELNKP